MVEFPVHKIQTIKLGFHIAQSVSIFVSWCLTIAVMRSSADIDGRIGWFFGLCFLSIPAIIYLTMTPRFPRTRRFANAYAMVFVDVLFCLLWLSAFAAVASFNSSKKCNGACNVSKAVVAFGVFTWLFFIVTTVFSIYSCAYYRRNGYLPGFAHDQLPSHVSAAIDPDKEAFSTAPHDDEYAPVHSTDDHDLHNIDGYSNSGAESRYDGAESRFDGAESRLDGAESRYDGAESRYEGTASRYDGRAPSYTETAYGPSIHDEDDMTSGYGGSSYGGSIGHSGRVKFPQGNYAEV
ncbi:hypothetical protein F5884DRAFT_103311 [Xylogone sp. PMI_703]|nr:hypothetical protein F5884DRAFT_103311 [Xylogone sp. PMI_703]